jgi:hypothetical protein
MPLSLPVPKRPLSSTQYWYHRLVRLYPREFRHQSEHELTTLFDDLYHEASQRPPGERQAAIARAYADTLAAVGREQFDTLMSRLTKQEPTMDTHSPKSFMARHRLSIIISTTLIAGLSLASLVTDFWGYNGPVAYAKRIVAEGLEADGLLLMPGNWEGVTANFVADYVQAKYYGDQRHDVGYQSRYAVQPQTKVVDGHPYTAYGLEQMVAFKYASMEPGFDPLTCSTQPPVAVRYTLEPVDRAGSAGVVAAFSYADSNAPDLVRYDLRLDQSQSQPGHWKVTQVDCLTLNNQANHPYKLADEPNPNKRKWDERFNRSFGPAQP